jgi:hypothetical protein
VIQARAQQIRYSVAIAGAASGVAICPAPVGL